MILIPTNIQTESQKKLFRYYHIFLYFFKLLNIIRSSRQKYGYIIRNFAAFQKMVLRRVAISTLISTVLRWILLASAREHFFYLIF